MTKFEQLCTRVDCVRDLVARIECDDWPTLQEVAEAKNLLRVPLDGPRQSAFRLSIPSDGVCDRTGTPAANDLLLGGAVSTACSAVCFLSLTVAFRGVLDLNGRSLALVAYGVVETP